MTTTTPTPSTIPPSASSAVKENQDKLIASLLGRLKSDDPNPEVNPLVVHESPMFSLTHNELSAIVSKNPEHPASKAFAEALKKTPADEHPLTVERIHVEAILDNKDVYIEEAVEAQGDQKFRVQRKKLRPFAK